MKNLQRGIIQYKNLGGVTVLFSAHHLIILYICTKFQENTFNTLKVTARTRFSYWKLQRAIILIKKMKV